MATATRVFTAPTKLGLTASAPWHRLLGFLPAPAPAPTKLGLTASAPYNFFTGSGSVSL